MGKRVLLENLDILPSGVLSHGFYRVSSQGFALGWYPCHNRGTLNPFDQVLQGDRRNRKWVLLENLLLRDLWNEHLWRRDVLGLTLRVPGMYVRKHGFS